MKKVMFMALLIFLSLTLYGQTKKDSAVVQYIQAESRYILLTDSINIPEKLRPYYGLVLNYFSKRKKMNKSDYYINASNIHEDANSLIISICHYEGFVIAKRDEEEGIGSIGNPGGKDGSLKIDKKRNKVVWFKLSM